MEPTNEIDDDIQTRRLGLVLFSQKGSNGGWTTSWTL